MNIVKLNGIMNCDCLQKIIENDNKKYTYIGSSSLIGIHSKDYKKAIENGRISIEELTPISANIIFETKITYERKLTPIVKNHITCDTSRYRIKNDTCGIPFLYCPICGTKTRSVIEEESFYSKLLK